MADAKGVDLETVLEQHGFQLGHLSSEAYEIWRMWSDLHTFRSYGDFGPKPLQMADVLLYLHYSGVPKRYVIRCLRWIAAVEHVYLKWVSEKLQKNATPGRKGTAS